MVVPAMAIQIINGPPATGTIPVKMVIDRWVELLLPDEIVLTQVTPFDPTSMWTNGLGTTMNIKANYDLEFSIGIAEDLGVTITPIGDWRVDFIGPLPANLTQTLNTVDYDIYALDVVGSPAWEPLEIFVELSNVDLSGAPYSPTAVTVANVTVTVMP